MKLLCTTIFTLAITTASSADIYQYSDCDDNGTLLLTELDAEPNADLSELYLGCANLSYKFLAVANLSYSNLDAADLSYTDLTSADLSNSSLSVANLSYATLAVATLSDADLTSANLSYATLSDAYLIAADLIAADLSYSHLICADLTGANLTGAKLTYAHLTCANLTGADLSSANLSFAVYWESATWTSGTYNDATIFPIGMDPDKLGMIYTTNAMGGSCCVTSGCDVMVEVMCTSLGGIWTEAGSCDDCVAPPETCDADLDGDGEVKVADLLLLIGAWGACP
jgi:uncharacterized protein YjbI with pentapeptide repeats